MTAAELEEAVRETLDRINYGFCGEGGIDRHTAYARAVIAEHIAPLRERADRLARELEIQGKHATVIWNAIAEATQLAPRLVATERALAQAREVLRWYADRDNWTDHLQPRDRGYGITDAMRDGGDRARAALADAEGRDG